MMGGNLIAWIKEEFFLFILTNNKDVSGRLLIDQIKDLASIQTRVDWHWGQQQRNKMGTEEKQLIRKMQTSHYWEVPLDSPVSIY